MQAARGCLLSARNGSKSLSQILYRSRADDAFHRLRTGRAHMSTRIVTIAYEGRRCKTATSANLAAWQSKTEISSDRTRDAFRRSRGGTTDQRAWVRGPEYSPPNADPHQRDEHFCVPCAQIRHRYLCAHCDALCADYTAQHSGRDVDRGSRFLQPRTRIDASITLSRQSEGLSLMWRENLNHEHCSISDGGAELLHSGPTAAIRDGE